MKSLITYKEFSGTFLMDSLINFEMSSFHIFTHLQKYLHMYVHMYFLQKVP